MYAVFICGRIVQEVYKNALQYLSKRVDNDIDICIVVDIWKDGWPHVTPYDLYSLRVYYLYKYVDMQM